jgi:hypothetical protein
MKKPVVYTGPLIVEEKALAFVYWFKKLNKPAIVT